MPEVADGASSNMPPVMAAAGPPSTPRGTSPVSVNGFVFCQQALMSTVLENTQDGRQIIVQGRCVSDIPAASLQISIGAIKYRLPVWLPRPDVHRAINANGDFPALCSLSSGIAGVIDLPIGKGRGTDLDLTFQVILADRQIVNAEGMTLSPGQGRQAHHKILPP